MRGRATQRTTYVNNDYASSPFVASYANDGNFNTNLFIGGRTCARTEKTPPVWWQVDLLAVYEISKVMITGRKLPPGLGGKYFFLYY